VSGTVEVARRTNPLAILALVAAFVASVVGVVLGVLALGQIRGTDEAGRGLAVAAIIIGVLVTGFFLFAFALPYLLNAL
jgi:peptidyl-prolyl cis-trans isomerase B (cyclophilin B)